MIGPTGMHQLAPVSAIAREWSVRTAMACHHVKVHWRTPKSAPSSAITLWTASSMSGSPGRCALPITHRGIAPGASFSILCLAAKLASADMCSTRRMAVRSRLSGKIVSSQAGLVGALVKRHVALVAGRRGEGIFWMPLQVAACPAQVKQRSCEDATSSLVLVRRDAC